MLKGRADNPGEKQYLIPMDRSSAWVTFDHGVKLAEMARKRGDNDRAEQLEEILTDPQTETRYA